MIEKKYLLARRRGGAKVFVVPSFPGEAKPIERAGFVGYLLKRGLSAPPRLRANTSIRALADGVR